MLRVCTVQDIRHNRHSYSRHQRLCCRRLGEEGFPIYVFLGVRKYMTWIPQNKNIGMLDVLGSFHSRALLT